ncbi:unnamed protein product [Durusdinium trenchii]|uniref:Uncharacterized protein n=1 Tax=Durusdinium trenchii TaxID=1381693 RepID=A0ABP0QJY0_9DINO
MDVSVAKSVVKATSPPFMHTPPVAVDMSVTNVEEEASRSFRSDGSIVNRDRSPARRMFDSTSGSSEGSHALNGSEQTVASETDSFQSVRSCESPSQGRCNSRDVFVHHLSQRSEATRKPGILKCYMKRKKHPASLADPVSGTSKGSQLHFLLRAVRHRGSQIWVGEDEMQEDIPLPNQYEGEDLVEERPERDSERADEEV